MPPFVAPRGTPIVTQATRAPAPSRVAATSPTSATLEAGPASGPLMAAGGRLGGAAGLCIGWAAGIRLACHNPHQPEDDLCAMSGIVLGGGIGEIVGVPLGVHLANRRHGSFPLDLLASAGIGIVGVLGLAILSNADSNGGVVAVTMPAPPAPSPLPLPLPLSSLTFTSSFTAVPGRGQKGQGGQGQW